MRPRKRKKIVLILIILFTLFIIATIIVGLYSENNIYISLIKKVTEMENYSSFSGKTYYISVSGSSSDGTDINNPMSLSVAKLKTYNSGDKILLKKGDIFYDNLNFNINAMKSKPVLISSYGQGENPIISNAKVIYEANVWEKYNNDIYRVDLTDTSNFSGLKQTNDDSCNVGFVYVDDNKIYGNRKKSLNELTNIYDFYCDGVYFYIKINDNPYNVLGKISLSTKGDLLSVSNNTVISNITFEFSSSHAIVKKDYPLCNVNINNCIFNNIGGGYQNGNSDTNAIRYGNAIELWLGSSNITIENNLIRNVYDAGVTLQGDDEKWEDIVIRNNIIIETCYSFELWGSGKSNGMKNVDIYNNISINQGKGWGQKVRDNQYNSANYVFYSFGENAKMGITIHDNRYYNSERLFYVYDSIADRFSEEVNVDKNFYYVEENTFSVNDNQKDMIKVLNDQYNIEKNSIFNFINLSEIKMISNPDILKSDDYNEIKEYYDNFDKKYNSKKATKSLIDSIDAVMNSEKYKELLNNNSINNLYLSLRNAINNLSESIDLTTKDSVSYSYECLYDLMETVSNEYYSNNLSEDLDETYLRDFIKDLDSLSSGYKEIYSYFVTDDNIDVSTIKNILNNAIEKYNNNLDLNIGYLEDIISTAKKIYNNYLTTDNVYENVFNKERITYITDVVNNILDIQINKSVESEKSKIKVEFDKDTTQPTSENITATITVGDETKINNNNGSNRYTFYENGTFTFDLEIRGVKFTLGVTINNISKNYKIDDDYITNITKNTLASTLKNELNISNYSIIRNGQEINLNTNVVSTGDILTYNDKSYTLIVNGDINKDGSCGIHDLVSFRKYLLKYITYDDIESMAADTNQDKELDIKDLVGIRKIILN